jgi:Fe-S cluster biogenesis protein NfuA
VEITKDMDVILNFGGGCQGCSSVKVTLKNGVLEYQQWWQVVCHGQ